MMKEDIIKILEQNAKEGWNGDVEAVGYADFESVAEHLVKLFAIPDVSNNEVALKAFVKEYVEAFEKEDDGNRQLYYKAKSLL